MAAVRSSVGGPSCYSDTLLRLMQFSLGRAQRRSSPSRPHPKAIRSMEELARRNLIRPVTTQGHIGDVLPDKIVYDAQTTSGGSGGPLFNNEGKVIGINFAMVREFGGSNFAIPVGFGKSLLKP